MASLPLYASCFPLRLGEGCYAVLRFKQSNFVFVLSPWISSGTSMTYKQKWMQLILGTKKSRRGDFSLVDDSLMKALFYHMLGNISY